MVNPYKVRKNFFRGFCYFLLYASMLIILIPFIIMFIVSLYSERELYLNVYPDFRLFPTDWNTLGELFANYPKLMSTGGATYRTFLNSIKIAIPTTIITTVVAVITAYPLSRTVVKGRNIILFLFLFASMVPTMAILIPLYLQFIRIGMYDKTWGVSIVLTAYLIPFSIWIMKSFFDTVPDSLEEAAMIDGCSRIKALTKIIIPLALPGIGAVAVYAFISAWSEFLIGLILTKSNAQPFTVYIGLFANTEYLELTRLMTAGVLSCLPVVVLALIFQRLIVRGLMEGGVKG